MTANELRIGNYVKFGKLFKKVVEIAEEGFYILDKDGTTLKNTWADLQPIPLTKEWLLKFGFDGCTAPNKCIKVGYNDDDFIHNQMSLMFKRNIIIKLNYVHQLQNLYFALTGEELVVSDAVS
jgi:hypothetical protein